MALPGLFLLVEGADDELFCKRVIQPLLADRYESVTIVTYSRKPRRYVPNLVRSIYSMGAEYVYLTDLNASPCITHRKEKVGAVAKALEPDRARHHRPRDRGVVSRRPA